MATINSVNNSLTSATGTGSFVGSDSHSLTGTLNWSSASSLEIPNNSAPTTSSAGQIAIDTTISGYTPLPQFNDGSNTLYAISIPSADLSTTNGNIVTYNSASGKFTLSAPTVTNGKVVGTASAVLSADFTTTSTSYTDSGLTISYTPTNASNILYVWARGFAAIERNAGTLTNRYGFYKLRRTTGTAADLSIQQLGMTNFTSSNSPLYQDGCMDIAFTETAGSTSSHTYIIQVATSSTNLNAHLYGDSSNLRTVIFVWELAV